MSTPAARPPFGQRRRVGEVRAPRKTLAFFEGGRIWSSPHGRARATGPAALFALRAVFEAAALIYGDVCDALKPFPQKARGSRGRDPRSRRWAAVTSVHALVIRWGRDSCLICKKIIIKKGEVLNWLLNERLNVFPTAVRAPSERAVGTVLLFN